MTLVFLGWQDERRPSAIAEAAFGAPPAERRRCSTAAGRAAAAAAPPRLFALDLDDEDGRAAALQAGASRALAAGGWYQPEERPFWPHVTLARVSAAARRVPPLPDLPRAAAPFGAAR